MSVFPHRLPWLCGRHPVEAFTEAVFLPVGDVGDLYFAVTLIVFFFFY